ncbi:MAG TPA: hypothetical protein VFU21_13095 [Kofleriaceae bacterium]|nr:hypothetical protein [Kofleriaceae bacterium]
MGALLVVMSGIGLAVVQEMRPMRQQPELAAWDQLFVQKYRGEISKAEFDRRVDALDIGIGGWMLRHDVYPVYLSVACAGILVGLVLAGVGVVRSRRLRNEGLPPR